MIEARSRAKRPLETFRSYAQGVAVTPGGEVRLLAPATVLVVGDEL